MSGKSKKEEVETIKDGVPGIHSYAVSVNGDTTEAIVNTKEFEIVAKGKTYKVIAPIEYGNDGFYDKNSVNTDAFLKLMKEKLESDAVKKKRNKVIISQDARGNLIATSKFTSNMPGRSRSTTIIGENDDFFTSDDTDIELPETFRTLFLEQFLKARNATCKIEYGEKGLKPLELALPQIHDAGIYGPLFTRKNDNMYEIYEKDMLAIATYFAQGDGSEDDFKPEGIAITCDAGGYIKLSYKKNNHETVILEESDIPYSNYNVDVLIDYIGALRPGFKDYLMAKDIAQRIELYGRFSTQLGIEQPKVKVKRLKTKNDTIKEQEGTKQGRAVVNHKGQFMISHEGIEIPEAKLPGTVIASMFFDPSIAIGGTAKSSNDPSFSAVFRPGSSRAHHSPTMWHRSLFKSDSKIMTDFGMRTEQTPALLDSKRRVKRINFGDFATELNMVLTKEGGLGFKKEGDVYKIDGDTNTSEPDFLRVYNHVVDKLANDEEITGAMQAVASNIAQAVILVNRASELEKLAKQDEKEVKADGVKKEAAKELRKKIKKVSKGKDSKKLSDLSLRKVAKILDPVLEQELPFCELATVNSRAQTFDEDNVVDDIPAPRFAPLDGVANELETVTIDASARGVKSGPAHGTSDDTAVKGFHSWKSTKRDSKEVGVTLPPLSYMQKHAKRGKITHKKEVKFDQLLDNVANSQRKVDCQKNIEVLVDHMKTYLNLVSLRSKSFDPDLRETANDKLESKYKNAFGPEDSKLSKEVITLCANVLNSHDNMRKVLNTGQFRTKNGEVLFLREGEDQKYQDAMIETMFNMARTAQQKVESIRSGVIDPLSVAQVRPRTTPRATEAGHRTPGSTPGDIRGSASRLSTRIHSSGRGRGDDSDSD